MTKAQTPAAHPTFRLGALALGILLAAATATTTGCTSIRILPGLNVDVPTSDSDLAAAGQLYNIQPVNAEVIRTLRIAEMANATPPGARLPSLSEIQRGFVYRVGPGDVLGITVWDHPELTNPSGQLGDSSSSGRLVQPDGTIFYPYVGSVKVSGLTVDQIRNLLGARLARTIREPQLDVRVNGFRSQRVQVTGEVRTPGMVMLDDTPRGVLDAINAQGGFSDFANRRSATLNRAGRIYPLDLEGLFRRGLPAANIALRPGDVINVGDQRYEKVIMLGELNTQATLTIQRGYMSLTEGLATAAGLNQSGSDARAIYIFRSNGALPGDGSIDRATTDQENEGVYAGKGAGTGVDAPTVPGKVATSLGKATLTTAAPADSDGFSESPANEPPAAPGTVPRFSKADADGFVVSAPEVNPTIYTLDMSTPQGVLLANEFMLQPRDVVYVSTIPLSRFNRVLAQLLPTVTTIFQTATIYRAVKD